MILTHLSLTNFRAFARLDVDVPRPTLLIVGENAQGKTTLLEAIYYLATLTSFHTESDRQLINFLAAREPLAVARIVAEFQRGEHLHRLEVRLIQENAALNGNRLRREILVDGVKRTAREALGHFNAVLFLPQMTNIIEGAPEERRRYLNMALAQVMPGYAQALSEYAQVLSQRNALLKQLAERGGDATQLHYWDSLLVERGALIIQARSKALNEMESLAARIHDRLTHGQEVLRLVYQPAYDPAAPENGQMALRLDTVVRRDHLSLNQIQQGFLRRLEALRDEEIQRGMTLIGPHRDEFRILSNGIDLGDYGSRGQVRTALMALKLAEVAWMRQKSGEWPVLLLDEVLAELDAQRRQDLLAFLAEGEQSLLTTTDLNLFTPAFVRRAAIWNIRAGCIVSSELPAQA